jgi:glycosyltransferase involved in cell wall biosynthesis
MSQGSGLTYASADAHGEAIAGERTLRVCVVSENIGLPLDEGFRKFARSLIDALGRKGPVLGISVGSPINAPTAVGVDADKLFLGSELQDRVKDFQPDLLCYVPTASDTVFSLLRLFLLARSCRQAATALVALQPRPHTRVGRWLMRVLAPDIVFVQSSGRAEHLSHIGCPVRWLPSGVDLERFRPVSPETKAALRAKHGLPRDAYLVLHVGHITRNRNVEMLEEVQRRWQVVMVAGNSVGEEPELQRRLRRAGVIVFDQFLEAVEEVYQAADCFIFPVSSEIGSIEIPLSVLEAMACDLPVVSTRFGGLEDLVQSSEGREQAGLVLADRPDELPELVAGVQANGRSDTRELVRPFTWDGVATRLLDGAGEVLRKERANR